MKRTIIKSAVSIVVIFIMMFMMNACGDGGPVLYDAPADAPYEGLYLIDRMNSKFSYKYGNGKHVFDVTMKWRTEDENIVSAQYTDEFFLNGRRQRGLFTLSANPLTICLV